MEQHPRLLAIARELLDHLERDGLAYALGGALALGYWSDPRGTLDIDLTVFVSCDELSRLFEVLEMAGAMLDREAAKKSANERGMFATTVHGFRLDLFIPDIPLYESARTRRRSVSFQGRPALIWSPEDCVLFKLLYFRTKDRADVETLVAVQGATLDVDYIRRWLVEMVGATDDRVRWFDSIAGSGPRP